MSFSMPETANKIICEYLLFLRLVGDTMVIEGAKHLNSQDSIKKQEKEQKYGHTPDLLSRSPITEENFMYQIWIYL